MISCPTCHRRPSERWGAETGSVTHDGITHPTGPIFAVGPCADPCHDQADLAPEAFDMIEQLLAANYHGGHCVIDPRARALLARVGRKEEVEHES